MQNKIPALFSLLLMAFSSAAAARYAAIVIDADNGEVIHDTEAAQRWYPASLTKVMTLYMTFAALESGKLQLDDLLTVSKHGAMQPKSKLGLHRGQKISVEHAILAVATRSANDAAVTLAEHLGGSEAHFAHLMTRQAHHMGMTSTNFVNASGLPDENQISSARDLAILSQALIKHFPEYYRYFSMTEFHYKGQVLPNTNRILKSYPDADGLKTGFTCGSGYNLIASAKRNGHRLVGVLLGAHSSGERFEQMGNLLDVGFQKKAAGSGDMHVSQLKDDDHAPPPFQLASNKCAGSAVQMGADVEAGDYEPIRIGTNGNHPRLMTARIQSVDTARSTVTFGRNSLKSQVEKNLHFAQNNLGALAGKGKLRIVKQRIHGKTAWQTVWNGLERDDAEQVCAQLQSHFADCVILATVSRTPAGRTHNTRAVASKHKSSTQAIRKAAAEQPVRKTVIIHRKIIHS